MEFIIISGLSGAGKSSAAAFLEDLGFYCVDNMPVALITNFAGLCMAGAGTGKYGRVALVTDIRGGQTFDELFQALDGLREMHLDYQLLFIEAADEDIVRRYKETRHTHPLTRQGYSLPEAVKLERLALEPVRRRASHILNSTGLNLSKFRGELLRLFGMGAIKMNQEIDMVIKLEPWDDTAVYDRLGLENTYTEILGVQLPALTIPVKPGRNLASIVEVAAMNNRNRKMGHNAALELTRRMDQHFARKMGVGDE